MFVMPEPVRAISFDIWNTLLRGNRAFSRARLGLIFDLLEQPGIDLEELHAAYRAADGVYNRESEETGIDYGMRDRLQFMYSKLAISASLPGKAALRAIQSQVGLLRLEPRYMPTCIEDDIVSTLRQLQEQGFILGLLSNTGMDNEQVMVPVLTKLGIWQYCATAIFSSEDGRAKPHPGLFYRMAGQLAVAAPEVLHVGDNVIADYGAKHIGMQAVVYRPGSSSDWIISSMKELVRT